MLNNPSGKPKKLTGTFSYQVNGTPVNLTIEDVDNTVANDHQLECVKTNQLYTLTAGAGQGDFEFIFLTDTLKLQTYQFTAAIFGPWYVMSAGPPQYVYSASDYVSFTITSYSNKHISGNFSGRLTPQLSAGTPVIWGTSGSTVITNGSFTNVPVR